MIFISIFPFEHREMLEQVDNWHSSQTDLAETVAGMLIAANSNANIMEKPSKMCPMRCIIFVLLYLKI